MPKTARMRELERRHKKPIEQIISDAYNKTGTLQGAADLLGIAISTLWAWMEILDIEVRAVAVPRRQSA